MSVKTASFDIVYTLERQTPSTPEHPYHEAGERRGEEELRAQLQSILDRQAAPIEPGEPLRDTGRQLSNLQRDAHASGFVVMFSLGGKDPQAVPIMS